MTIYLDENKFNDLTKSPLRIKVLESLAIKGKLSKSMAESLFSKMHYYPDISNAFDNLLQNSLIEGAGKKVGRGRPEVFYRITDEGLALIIYKYHHDPKKFWSLLTGFCYHRDKQVSLDRVDEFYSLFVNKHLKYPSGHNYFFQLDLFSKMSDKWIQDNAKNKNKISLEQKVIETLSMYPTIALKELVKKIEELRQEKVIKVLDSYTMKKLHYTDIYDTDKEDSYSENPLAQYLDLMHHCIVTVGHTAKGVETYELSLFGIIIVMTLVRYHEMGRIGSLFYNGILLQDYYNKIASNYKYALPLIFGKWYLLKTHLKIWSAYNFDIILGGKQVRSKALHSSVLAKGNKEFYENMQPISEFSSNQIGRINNLGIEVLENYKRDKNEYQFVDNNNKRKTVKENEDDGDANDRVIAISQKLQEIFILMKYTHPWAFQEDLVREEVSRYATKNPYLLKSMRTDNNDSGISVIDILTKAFEKEITFLYYLNLFNDFYNPLMSPNAGFDSVLRDSAQLLVSELSTINASSTQYWYPISLSPKEKLLLILQNDESIKTNFLSWIEDIINYQKEATESMSKSYLEVKERIKMKNGN